MSKVPEITVPFAPIVPKGETEPVVSTRLRPFYALNLRKMLEVLDISIIKTKMIDKKSDKKSPWSVIAAISPYSDDFHVMLMETDKNRYLPGLEDIEEEEGDSLMNLWIDIVRYMKAHKTGNIYVGYNWSPRSWGNKEEQTGFQSIPTKWHGMFWVWPDLEEIKPDEKAYERIKSIDEIDTSVAFKRLNEGTYFANDMVTHLQEKIDEIKKDSKLDSKVQKGSAKIDKGAYIIEFNLKMEDLFKSEKFFSKFLKPIAEHLNTCFKDLTDLFFKEPWCDKADEILKKTSNGMISHTDYKFLQTLPELKENDEILGLLNTKGFSKEAQKELMELVKNRYLLDFLSSIDLDINTLMNEKGFSNDLIGECKKPLDTKYAECINNGWRKGFAYTLTFKEINSKTELKITPGAYLGPAGVVETEGVVLKRPENYKLPTDELIRKSEELHYQFAPYLK